MTPTEAARMLAKAAAFDQRTIGEADARAWAEALEDVSLTDGLAAVTWHYRASRDRLMPVHVLELSVAFDHERRRLEREHRELLATEAAATDPRPLSDRSPELQAFVASVRSVLPPGNPDALRRPEVLAWEHQRARAERPDAGPNPHYDPAVAAREEAR